MIESILHRDVGSTEIVAIAIAAMSGKHKEVEAEAARGQTIRYLQFRDPFLHGVIDNWELPQAYSNASA